MVEIHESHWYACIHSRLTTNEVVVSCVLLLLLLEKERFFLGKNVDFSIEWIWMHLIENAYVWENPLASVSIKFKLQRKRWSRVNQFQSCQSIIDWCISMSIHSFDSFLHFPYKMFNPILNRVFLAPKMSYGFTDSLEIALDSLGCYLCWRESWLAKQITMKLTTFRTKSIFGSKTNVNLYETKD